MKLEAQFVSSALALADCPGWDCAEVAFAGRSNVGKSSLLNALTGTRGLARTSKTPGRTRCLNFFAACETLALVDLPGYGYAKMSHADAAKLADLLRAYLEKRRNLVALVMLVDARRGPQREELELAAMVRARRIALIVAATKCDKLRNSERAAAIKRFTPLGLELIMCSAKSGEKIDELRRLILARADARDSRRAREA
jgi:GTP-binding protein